jgi:hypothetical protein
MKKIFITLAALTSFALANAQEFKPLAGKVALELNAASPFAASTPFLLPQYGFKARYFITDQLVGRLGFNWDLTNSTTPKVLSNGTDKEDETTSSYSMSIVPGFEKHFEGTERLSPYIGAIIPILFGSSEDVTFTGVSNVNKTKKTITNATGFTSVGLGLLSGADFYFIKSLYLGVEFGLTLNYATQKDKETSYEVTGGTAIPTETVDGGTTFKITPAANAAFRLGYWF